MAHNLGQPCTIFVGVMRVEVTPEIVTRARAPRQVLAITFVAPTAVCHLLQLYHLVGKCISGCPTTAVVCFLEVLNDEYLHRSIVTRAHVPPTLLEGAERRVSKSANRDTCPRPATGRAVCARVADRRPGHRGDVGRHRRPARPRQGSPFPVMRSSDCYDPVTMTVATLWLLRSGRA